MIGKLIENWRVVMAVCTCAAVAIVPALYVLTGGPDHAWIEGLIGVAFIAVTVYALVISRWFTRIERLNAVNKTVVISAGTLAMLLVSTLFFALLVVVWLFVVAITGRGSYKERPLEVKLARNFWTGKLER